MDSQFVTLLCSSCSVYSRLDRFDQSGTFYSDMTVGGTKVTKLLFGGRVKEVGDGALEGLLCQRPPNGTAPLRQLYGYINNGSMFHCLTVVDESATGPTSVLGCVFSPSHFMKPIRYGTLEAKTSDLVSLSFQVRTQARTRLCHQAYKKIIVWWKMLGRF